jgi:hypothetical protein
MRSACPWPRGPTTPSARRSHSDVRRAIEKKATCGVPRVAFEPMKVDRCQSVSKVRLLTQNPYGVVVDVFVNT